MKKVRVDDLDLQTYLKTLSSVLWKTHYVKKECITSIYFVVRDPLGCRTSTESSDVYTHTYTHTPTTHTHTHTLFQTVFLV
jgi:hypothetical protein